MFLRRCNLRLARGPVTLNPRPKRVISALPICHASIGYPIASHHPLRHRAYRASSSDTFSNAIDKQNVSEAQRRAAQLELQQMNQSTSRILGLQLTSNNVSEVISEATVNEVKSAIHYWSRRWYMHFHPGFRRAAKGSALCASDFKTFMESTQQDAAKESDLLEPTNFSGDHGARQAEKLLDWAISNDLVARGAFDSSMDQSRMNKEEHLGMSPNLPFVNIIETYLLPTVYGGVGNSIEESAREEALGLSRKNEYGTALKHSVINASYVRALADATRVMKKMKHTQSTYHAQVAPDTLSIKAELNVWAKRAILLGRGTADDIALLRQSEEDSANEEGIEMYGSEADTVQGCMRAMDAIITQAEKKFATQNNENLRPSVDWYNHFIGALARSGTECALAKAQQVLGGMEAYEANGEISKDGRKCYAAPDVITYNGVLFCMTRDGSKSGAVEAKKLLERMNCGTNNVRPDEVTYGTVLHSLAQAGMADEAERLLEFLEDAFNQSSGDDGCITPSLTVYNTVLNALANSHEPHAPQHAESLLDRMKALSSTGKNPNVEPDAISISSVILAHARSKTRWGAERGEELLNQAMDNFVNEGNARVKPDAIMLNCALTGWTSLPDTNHGEDAYLVNDEEIAVKRAENLLFRMLELADQCDVLPVAHSFNIVLDCWAKSEVDGAADGALELLRLMSDYGVEPDEISYNSLLHAMSKESDPWWSTQADNIIREMREKKIPLSIITYNVLMSVRGRSMAKDGAARAEELLRNMENEGFSRNEISYNICIDAYARRGNHVKAESLLSEMLSIYEDEGDLSCRPSIHSFASVVNALAKSRDTNAVPRAEEIIQKAEELDYISLNSYLYNSFIDCIVNSDAPDKSSKAEAVLMKMEQQQQLDVKPTEYSYSMVLTCCARSGEHGSAERAERILNNMETLYSLGQSSVVANSRCYSAVITAFARSKSPDAVSKAFQLVDRMEKNRKEGSPHGHPNAHCYNSVVHAIAKSRGNHKAEKCKDILERMILARDLGHRDCSPTIITYSTILNACAFDGKSHEEMREAFNLAKSTFQTLLESSDMEPNESIYANFLQCISRQLKPGKTRDEFAEAVFTEGCSQGFITAAVMERFKQAAPAPAHEILDRHKVIPRNWQRRAKASY